MGKRRRGRSRKRPSGEAGTEVVYGLQPVAECLEAGRREVRELWIARKRDADTEAIVKAAEKKRVSVSSMSREELSRRLGHEDVHQGIALVVTPFPYVTLAEVMRPTEAGGSSHRRLLLCDGIQDPRNLGAMLRTVEAAGFQGAIVAAHRAAPVTPVAVKASAGAAEHLPVARVTNIANAIGELKEAGFWMVGLDADGSVIYEADLDMDLVLVVGAEGAGIRPRTRSLCDLIVSLPMAGRVASLNASAAVAAAVFQVVKTR